MTRFLRYNDANSWDTPVNGETAIDNTGYTSAAVDLRGAPEFNLEVTYNGSGATDAFIVTLFGSIDGTEFGDYPATRGDPLTAATAFPLFKWQLPASASEVTRVINVPNFHFPHLKVKVESESTNDTFASTVKLQRIVEHDTAQL